MPTAIRRTVPLEPPPVKTLPTPAAPVLSAEPPAVIVDFLLDRGLLSVALINLDTRPAYRVSVAFSAPFKGLGGSVEISALRLFKQVEFLAPGKRIEAFIDTADAYFRRREPIRIEAIVTHHDAAGQARRHRIVHDLAIYQDLVHLVPPSAASDEARRPGPPPTPPSA